MKERNGATVYRFDEIDSTNDYAKTLRNQGKDCVIIAKRQTGGRGTKGRSFSSMEGGVYMTKLTFHQQLPTARAFEIMASTATAVCKTLRAFGVTPKIKWPNDIYAGDKKICGILIENTFSGANVACSVVGIGINIYNTLPEELKEIATSVLEQTGKRYSVETVTEHLLDELFSKQTMEEYLSFVGYMGKQARILVGDLERQATLLSVDREGGLWVLLDGEKQRFVSTEISLRV